MDRTYQHIFTPLTIRGITLKNRIEIAPISVFDLDTTPERHPSERDMQFFRMRAMGGAAVVTLGDCIVDPSGEDSGKLASPKILAGHEDNLPFLTRIADEIHRYGAVASIELNHAGMLRASAGVQAWGPDYINFDETKTIAPLSDQSASDEPVYRKGEVLFMTEEMIETVVDAFGRAAEQAKTCGFEMAMIHAGHGWLIHQFLSPLTNHRTDEYGGSVENRSRFLLEIFQAIRKAVGPSIPLEVVYSVSEPEGGYTVEDTIEFCKLAEGLIDIIHLRSGEMDPQHPLGFTSTEAMPTPYLEEMGQVCRAVHQLGLNMVVGASAGFQDPDWANRAVAEGKADLIYMARAWINNPDYGQKVFEGRAEDIVPCIRCNKCHVSNGKDMWRSVCSVNPELGFQDKLERMVPPVGRPQKVAVVGGGPAGLEFARIAAQRGHNVTLYEASGKLGGQLKHADYPSFKWPLKQFKNFMIAQMDRLGVEVHLNTKATPELLSGQGYDVVAVAVGSTPSAPPMPGVDGPNVHFASKIYGAMEDQLSDDIVLIGGGEIGVETALYLCELGKRVTVLEMLPELIADAPHAHYKNMVHNYWRKQPNFHFQCGVKVTSIDPDGVNFTDHKGQAHKIACGDVLLSIGSRPLTDEVMSFAGVADRMMVIGDCDKVANVQRAMRSAWSAAVSI